LFDSDGTGQIKPKDMIKTFERLGLHKEKPSIYKLILSMNTVDNNLEGLNFDQFMNLTIQYYSDRYTREGIKHIFELFDEEGLGYITRDTLRKVIFQLGMALNKDELDEIFDKASTDSERKVITYDDFEFFMKKDEIKQ
jgi:centrin-1